MIHPRIIIVLLFILFLNTGSVSQDESGKIRVMFYNVENAFDIYDDPNTSDDEFLPEGERRWTWSRYQSKINSIYKSIILAGGWTPPEIIAFSEIENRQVVQDLLNNTYLSKYKYNIIHEDSPDPRGIDVCLVFREDSFSLCSFSFLKPYPEYYSRPVLYAKLRHINDTIHLFFNHWPSRRGGILSSQDNRLRISAMLRGKADSISLYSPGSKIIIAGDFNCNPGDEEMKLLCDPENGVRNYYNLTDSLKPGAGTYRYKGVWERFDQVIITQSLMNSNRGLKASKNALIVITEDFLLADDPVYPGKSPNSTYRGLNYQGGISDHLPVILILQEE